MIELRNFVTKRDGSVSISDTNIEFLEGGFTLIVGRSGVGKTTALASLSGLGKSLGLETDGSWYRNDEFLGKVDHPISPICSFVHQNAALFEDLTVLENLLSVVSSHDKLEETNYHVFSRLLEDVNFDSFPSQLSGGQKQRVAIVRSLLTGSRIVVLDEPNAGLDYHSEELLLENFKVLRAAGIHVVVSAHHFQRFIPLTSQVLYLDEDKLSLIEPKLKTIRQKLRTSSSNKPKVIHTNEIQEYYSTKEPRFWWLRLALNDLWNYVMSPSGFLFVAVASLLVAYTSGYIAITRYPFSELLLDLTIVELISGLGSANIRFSIPLFVAILISTRCCSIMVTDLLQKQYSGSSIVLKHLSVPIYRVIGFSSCISMSLSALVMYLLGFVVFLYAMSFAIAQATEMSLALVRSFIVSDVIFPEGLPRSFWWIFSKMVLSGLLVGLISLFFGTRRVLSGFDIREKTSNAVLFSVLGVICLHAAFVVIELY